MREIVAATRIKGSGSVSLLATRCRSTCQTTRRHVPRTRDRGNLSHVASVENVYSTSRVTWLFSCRSGPLSRCFKFLPSLNGHLYFFKLHQFVYIFQNNTLYSLHIYIYIYTENDFYLYFPFIDLLELTSVNVVVDLSFSNYIKIIAQSKYILQEIFFWLTKSERIFSKSFELDLSVSFSLYFLNGFNYAKLLKINAL